MKRFILFFLLTSNLISGQNCDQTEVLLQSQTQDWGFEISWSILDEEGVEVAAFQGTASDQLDEQTVCLADGCYTVEARDSFGDGWNGGSLRISIEGGATIDYTLEDGSVERFVFGVQVEGCILQVLGCTNPSALNYNPEANEEDGSCTTLEELISGTVLDTIHYGGPKDNRINWVIQNRGAGNPNGNFSSREEFVEALEEDLYRTFIVGDETAQIPYAQYSNFFNLYGAYWENAPSDQDWWSFNIIKQMRDQLFLPWANERTGWVSWFSTTKNGGGGGAGLERDRRVGDAKIFGMGWETFLHEFGHTMPGLLDEYSSSGVWSNGQCWETPNTTGFTERDEIPWRLWIAEDTPLPTPYNADYLNTYGAFEGGLTNFFGCHRPTARGCYMGAGGFGEGYGLELCGPCRQRVICYLYQYVDVIENPQPAQNELEVTGAETMRFSAEVLKPEPNTQKYEWFLNGKLIAEDVEEVELTFGACDVYELVFAVTDINPLVRYDPKFAHIYPKPYQEFKWTIDQTDVTEYNLIALATGQAPNCTGEPNGQIAFEAGGGLPPYSIYYQGELIQSPFSNLAAGEYIFEIVDANGCSAMQTVTLAETPILEVQLCTAYENGAWNIWVETPNHDLNTLTFSWSNGETTSSIMGVPNDTYSVEVFTSNGCSVQEFVTLSDFEEAVAVEARALATEVGRETGQISLDIRGGVPPYTVTWADIANQDITDANSDFIAASGTTWDHLPQYAFDDDLGEKWLHFVSSDAWISYHVPEGAVVNYYTITSGNDVPGRDPKDWRFEGSNDGENWTLLDRRTDESFSARFEKRGFLANNSETYTYYRFYVEANHGDGSIQLQQLEFIGVKNGAVAQPNPKAENLSNRTELGAGSYQYTVKDANLNSVTNSIPIAYAEPFQASDLVVIPNGRCSVAVENPDANFDYYWASDEEMHHILHIGNDFSPPISGNFYVAAVNATTKAMSQNRKGFAITMPQAPMVETLEDNSLQIVAPQADYDYHWYATEACSEPLHTGTTFIPPMDGTAWYYATAQSNRIVSPPINPRDLEGLTVHIDASDLNGDGFLDNPAPPTSSTLNWNFQTGGQWGGWFAFRSNYQNGLGIADFATIWWQSLDDMPAHDYQTIVMAYQENPISFPETAPFGGLSQNIPRHSDATQLFSNDAPDRTLNGSTFLNGVEVNPLTTANPLDFCVLGVRMTEMSNNQMNATDPRWEGKLGEMLLWNRPLSDEEIQGLTSYLQQKWIRVADLESPKTAVFWEDATNIEEGNTTAIQFFPNPVANLLEVNGLKAGQVLQLLDLQGRLVQAVAVESKQLFVQVGGLESGVYVLQVLEGERVVFVRKVVKE